MDASEIHARRLNAKEVLTPHNGENIFPIADGTVKLSGGDQVLSISTLIQERNHSQFHYDTLTWPELRVRPWMWCLNAAWTIIGMSRETETYQMRGRVSHDSPYWMKNLQTGTHGRGAGDKKGKQHPGLITCGQRYGKIRQKQLNDKKSRSGLPKKPKLDNAGGLRGIYFIDPADAEFKETIKNAWRKLEVPMPAAMPCKIRGRKYKETCRTPDTRKTKCACIVEAHESTRKRLEETLHKDHEDHIAVKGTSLFPCLKPWKYQMRKQDKEWETLDKILAWQLTNVRNKKRGDRWCKERRQNSALRVIDGHLSFQEFGVGTKKFKKYKGRVVFRGDIVTDYSGSYAVFTE